MDQLDENMFVQRPFGYAAIIVKDRVTDSSPIMKLKHNWSSHTIERIWNFGYQSSRLEQLFNSIPPELSALMKRGLQSVQIIRRLQPSAKDRQRQTTAESCMRSSDEQEFLHLDADRWEHDDVHGFLQISYDPATNRRTNVVLNSRYAHLHGYHKEEMLARFGNHDLEVQLPDIDWLAYWLDHFQVKM